MYILPFSVIPKGVTKAQILLLGYIVEQIPPTKMIVYKISESLKLICDINLMHV